MATSLRAPQTPAEILDAIGDWSKRFDHVHSSGNYDDMCDVTFRLGETLVKSNRYILGLRSDAFKKMFYGPLRHKLDDIIEILDVDLDVFLLLLEYIYTDHATLTGDTVLAALYVAKKYRIQGLEDLARSFLKSNITPDNVCTILTAALFHEEKDIEMKCLQVIDAETEVVIKSVSFQALSYDTVMVIVKRDQLCIDEGMLFEEVLRWADAECERRNLEKNTVNRRKVLGDILYQIRFPTMNADLFAEAALKTKMLTGREISNVYLHRHSKKEQLQSLFPTIKRKGSNDLCCLMFYVPVTEINDVKKGLLVDITHTQYKTILFGSEPFDNPTYWLFTCKYNDEICQNAGPERGSGCCLIFNMWCFTRHSDAFEKMSNSCWVEVINNDEEKSVRSHCKKPYSLLGNANYLLPEIKKLLQPSSGFIKNDAIQFKLHFQES